MGTKYFRNTKSYKGLFLGTQKIIRPVAVTFSLVTSTTPTTGSIPMPPPIYERKLLDNISKKVAAGVEILHCEWFAILSYPSLLLLVVETEKGNNGSGCRHDRIDIPGGGRSGCFEQLDDSRADIFVVLRHGYQVGHRKSSVLVAA